MCVRLSSVTNTSKVTFIHYSEGQMTENKTIIYTLLMSKLKHSTLEGERIFPSKLKKSLRTRESQERDGWTFCIMSIQTKKFLFHSLDYLNRLMLSIFSRCERQKIIPLGMTQTYPLSSSYLLGCQLHTHTSSNNDSIVTNTTIAAIILLL